MAGYDISAAVSESSTQGFQKRIGDFTVGGGGKAASVWPLALAAVVIAFLFFNRKR